MRILHRYVYGQMLLAFGLTIFITTFVGVLALLPKLFDVIAEGVTVQWTLLFLLYNLPNILCYTLPIGLLVAAVLVFNRMSADNEVMALRASGVGLLQLTAPAVLLALAVSGVCWWLRFEVAPECWLRAQSIAKAEALKNPVALFAESPDAVFFKGFFIMHGGRVGRNGLKDVNIFVQDLKTGELRDTITARRGEFEANTANSTLILTLHDATVVSLDPEDPQKPSQRTVAAEWRKEIDYAQHLNSRPLVRRTGEMTMSQLFSWLQIMTAQGRPVGPYLIELHWRAAWAVSPFTFILIGIPLGLQIARRETLAGIIGCVGAMAAYYIPMSLLSTAVPEGLHPELMMWALNLGFQTAGLALLWRRR